MMRNMKRSQKIGLVLLTTGVLLVNVAGCSRLRVADDAGGGGTYYQSEGQEWNGGSGGYTGGGYSGGHTFVSHGGYVSHGISDGVSRGGFGSHGSGSS